MNSIDRYSLDSLADLPLTLTATEAIALLGLGRSHGYDLIRRGEIPSRRLGRRVVVPTAEFLDFLGVPVSTNRRVGPRSWRPATGHAEGAEISNIDEMR